MCLNDVRWPCRGPLRGRVTQDNSAQRRSQSFLLPVDDKEFILSDEMRPLRFAMEYAKAKLALRKACICFPVVVFGRRLRPSPHGGGVRFSHRLRIMNANVTAVVQGDHRPADSRVRLESMTVGGVQAYGGLATLPPRHRYRVEIEVVRSDVASVRATFTHQHLQP